MTSTLVLANKRISSRLVEEIPGPTLLRVASLPLSRINFLGCTDAVGTISTLLESLTRGHALGRQIAEDLYAVIGITTDVPSRRALLSLRRSLFAARALNPTTLDLIPESDQALRQAVAALLEARSAIDTSFNAAEARWAQEGLSEESALRAFAQNPFLRLTLSYANPSLFAELQRSEQRSDRPLKPQLRRSLVRYMTRMALKPSPFGTLSWIQLGEDTAREERVSQRALANKSLLPFLVKRLSAHVGLKSAWPVRVNPSVAVRHDRVTWIMTEGRLERFYGMDLDDALRAFLAVASGSAMPFDMLASHLSNELSASKTEVIGYLEILIREGLLLRWQFSYDQDTNWISAMQQWLATTGSAVGAQAGEVLRRIHSAESLLNGSPLEISSGDVATMIKSAQEGLDRLTSQIGEERFSQPLVHVDSRVAAARSRAVVDLASAFSSLDPLLATLALLSPDRADRLALTRILDLEFGDVSQVSLVDFYRAAFEKHFHAVFARELASGQPHSGAKSVLESDERILAHQRLRLSFRKRLADWLLWSTPAGIGAGSINLSRLDLAGLVGRAKRASESLPLTVFYHELSAEDLNRERPAILVPNGGSAQGFGKYLSRYLHLYDRHEYPMFTDYLRSWEERGVREIHNDCFFNANLHPEMYRRGIAYPSIDCERGDEQLRIEELAVSRNATGQAVLSSVSSGQEVLPVDLGFLSDTGRPGLYRLLKRFQPTARTYIEILDWWLSANPAAMSMIVRLPRVVFDDCVILQRCAWVIPPVIVEEILRQASSTFALLRWWLGSGLPTRFFIRVHGLSDSQGKNRTQLQQDAAARAVRPDSRKPQFIDVNSPLLLDLALDLFRTRPSKPVVLEECLPSSDDTVHFGGDLHRCERVTERLIHLHDAIVLD
jgi:antitoxin component of RelBE/YafQ-DinJ toxin-antitoxin module